jgi:hypothetical protein
MMNSPKKGGIFARLGLFIAFFVGTCLVILVLGEIGLRFYHKVSYGTPFFRVITPYVDTELGWKGKMVFGDPSTAGTNAWPVLLITAYRQMT